MRRLILLACLLTAGTAQAQLPPVTRTVAIVGASIVPSPGEMIDDGTIIIRDGIITAIGSGVDVPFDARVIQADSMWVYPGFVDVLSHAGINMPDPPDDLPALQSRADPPDDRAGITPMRRAERFVEADSDDFERLRSAGFTAAHVVPEGRMLPGTGAVLLLRGQSANDMVLQSDASVFLQFTGASGMYPSTPMGIMAKFRQLYRESDRRRTLSEDYARNPVGMTAPPFDPVHESFYPITTGGQTVAAHAADALEARRVLRLQDELGFRLLLTGLSEGFDMTDALVGSDAAFGLTLSLPDSARWLRGINADSLRDVLESYDPDQRTATFRDVEAELRNLEVKQAQSLQTYASNAGALHKAGLRFGFSTLGADADDLHKNLRAMIAAGLPKDAALSALTIDGARAIGQERVMGSLEVGKLGNAVLMDRPLFEADASVAAVIVAGERFDTKDEEASSAADLEKVVGRWRIDASGTFGEIVLREDGSKLRGTVTYDGVPQLLPIRKGSIVGDRLTLDFQSPNGAVRITATVSGSSLEGTAQTPDQTIPLTGKKTP